MEHYASTPRDHIFKAVIPAAGHISVFMGRRALRHEWPEALRFVQGRIAAGKDASACLRENETACLS
jgi:hypothetical protein